MIPYQQKECKKCKIYKKIIDFKLVNDGKYVYYRNECIECYNAYIRAYCKKRYEKNKKEINAKNNLSSEEKIARKKERERLRLEKIPFNRERKRKWTQIYENTNEIKEYRKKSSKIRYEKKKNDIEFKLRNAVNASVVNMLKSMKSKKNYNSLVKHLPFTIVELKKHVEDQFINENSWMNWNNYGKYNAENHDKNPTWNLDHIIPQSDLKYSSMKDDNFQKCWDLSNLRPLDARQNNLDGATRVRHKK